jgi:surface protein
MPTITSTEQKVAALFLVGDNNSNFVAFRFSGNYTVDWGDGNTENVLSGVTAEHNYSFSSLSPATEFGPVGSKSRQAMIVITPQAGQNFTSISFNFKHSSLVGLTYTTPILEIIFSAPSCTALLIGNTTGNLRLLEQCTILSHNATNLENLFNVCSSLQSVPLFNTSAATSINGMFSGCSSLQNVPLLNTSAVTNMNFMFNFCPSLQNIPLFNTSAVTSMISMFTGCSSLQSIPALNCSSATTITSFANNCNGLKRCLATGIKGTISFAGGTLGATELNEIYTNLADLTALPTQTITVTNNYGTATDNPAIATAKNWTVVG